MIFDCIFLFIFFQGLRLLMMFLMEVSKFCSFFGGVS